MINSFKGTPREIGLAYGKFFSSHIHSNLDILVRGIQQDDDFRAWVKRQEDIIAGNWQWLLEEMASTAAGAGVSYEDILLLNLRAWQYEYYGAPAHSCSSLAITLADGTIACTGTLDDSADLYCGPVKISPSTGHSFITFPIAGTSWGNRAMNSAGLAVGISSQILPGLVPLSNAINQDLAVRVILQTCSTVDDVREFCLEHPFTMNLVCVDVFGGILCAHQTAAGFFEYQVTDGYCALTNHVEDSFMERLRDRGVTNFPEAGSSRPRRNNLLRFASERSGKCSAEEVLQFISARDDDRPESIHNYGTVYITFADPQTTRDELLIMQPKDSTEGFQVFHI